MFGRRKIATLVAEFLGTGVLTLLLLSVARSNIGAITFFVALAAGLTVALMTFAVGTLSGANFNPALTFGMWTARRIPTLTALLYIVAQLLGAWAAYGLYTYLANTSLKAAGGHFTARILIAEAVGTGIFALGWASSFYQRFTPAVAASVSGLSYMVGIVAASSAAIGLLNPAVAFGVRAQVLGTYILGPFIGAVVAINLYKYLFAAPVLAAASEVAAAAVSPVATTKNTAKSSEITTTTAAKRLGRASRTKTKTAAKPKRRTTAARKR